MGVHCTVEEFEKFVDLPENAQKYFEYIAGEMVEKLPRPYAAAIAARVSGYLSLVLKNTGHITGVRGGYIVDGERYAPDVAFISKSKQAHLAERGYNPAPPDLAVEVLSPSNDPGDMRIKTVHYLRAGTVVWIGDVLPGFTLAVKDIFPE